MTFSAILFAGALVVGFAFGYPLSIAIGRLLSKLLRADPFQTLALSCALTLAVLAVLAALAAAGFSDVASLFQTPKECVFGYSLGTALVFAVRARRLSRLPYYVDVEDEQDQADEAAIAWDVPGSNGNYLVRHWRGHLSLPLSYWVNCVLLSLALLIAALGFGKAVAWGRGSLRLLAMGVLATFVLSLLLALWGAVGTWRSAGYHVRRGGLAGWAWAARIAITLGMLSWIVSAPNLIRQAKAFGQLAMGSDPLGAPASLSLSGDGRSILVRGFLTVGTADRFSELLSSVPAAREVILTSNGGRLLEAMRMAELIKARGMNTRVDDVCLSACTFVLLAGRERTSPGLARIGFHQPSFPGFTARQQDTAVEKMRDGYLEAGVDPDFLSRVLETPPEQIWVPTRDELIQANVITGSDITVRASGQASQGVADPSELSIGEQRLQAALLDTERAVAPELPRRLDKFTTFESIKASGFTLTYGYRLDLTRSQIGGEKASLKAEVAADIERRTCSDAFMSAAIQDGASFVYRYADRNGAELFTIPLRHCS